MKMNQVRIRTKHYTYLLQIEPGYPVSMMEIDSVTILESDGKINVLSQRRIKHSRKGKGVK